MAVLARNLVNARRVSCRDKVVTMSVLVDRINVEVVPRQANVTPIPADLCCTWGHVAFGRVDMIKTFPLKQDFARLHVHFLERALLDIAESVADFPLAQIGGASQILSHES